MKLRNIKITVSRAANPKVWLACYPVPLSWHVCKLARGKSLWMVLEPLWTVCHCDFFANHLCQFDIIARDSTEFVSIDINLDISIVGQMKIRMMLFSFGNHSNGIERVHGCLEILGCEPTAQGRNRLVVITSNHLLLP